MSTSFSWKAKAGMVHSVSGWTRGVQVKLWDPLRTRAIPEHDTGVFTTRRYTNPRLPFPYLTTKVVNTKIIAIYWTFLNTVTTETLKPTELVFFQLTVWCGTMDYYTKEWMNEWMNEYDFKWRCHRNCCRATVQKLSSKMALSVSEEMTQRTSES